MTFLTVSVWATPLIQEVSFDLCGDCGVRPSLAWALTLTAIAIAFSVAGGIFRSKGNDEISWSCFATGAFFLYSAYQFG